MGCRGDSGGPIMWKDEKDLNRVYLMGIMESGSSLDNKCAIPLNNFATTIATTVPGNVMSWIKGLNYPEINECLQSQAKEFK